MVYHFEATPTPDESNPYQEVLPYIKDVLASDNQIFRTIDITEQHLRRSHLLAPEETLDDFFVRCLRLDRSIAVDALHKVWKELPAPTDTDVVNTALASADLAGQEEALRMAKLSQMFVKDPPQTTEIDEVLLETTESGESEEGDQAVVGFLHALLLRADTVEINGVMSQDPEKYLRDPALFEDMAKNPAFYPVEIQGEKCWSVVVPHKSSGISNPELAASFDALVDMYKVPGVDDRIVVFDQELNADLTSILLSSPELTKRFVEAEILGIQHNSSVDLKQLLVALDHRIVSECRKTSDDINQQATQKLFNLIKGDAELGHGLELSLTTPKGIARKYAISPDTEGNLVFSYLSKETMMVKDPLTEAQEEKAKRTIFYRTPSHEEDVVVKHVTKLRISEQGLQSIDFTEPDIHRLSVGEWSDNTFDPIFNCFDQLKVCQLDGLIDSWGAPLPDNLQTLLAQITKINSSIELFELLQKNNVVDQSNRDIKLASRTSPKQYVKKTGRHTFAISLN